MSPIDDRWGKIMATPQIAEDGSAKIADSAGTFPDFREEVSAITAACDDFMEQLPIIARELNKIPKITRPSITRPSLAERVARAHQELSI